MSSIAQDELGHAAALYGLLGGLTGTDPGRPRLRPRAGRVPPLPAARPRPRRLGDDDRPALPVRHVRCRPARGAGRRRRGRRWPSSSASSLREERYHRMHAGHVARAAGPERRASRANACWRRSTELAPDAATVFTPLDGEAGAGRRRDPGRADDRARGALAGLDRADVRGSRPADATGRARDPDRGRLDHGEPFRWLWGEFTTRPSLRPRSDLVSEAGTQVGIARLRAGAIVGARRAGAPRRRWTRPPSAPLSPR